MQNFQYMVNLFNMFHSVFNLLKLFLHSTPLLNTTTEYYMNTE